MLKSKTNVGVRDRRIIIQEETTAKDDYNQDVGTWGTFATVWSSVKDSPGNERYQADQITAYRITEFDIRYLSGLKEKMRILFNDRYYNVRSFEYPDRNRSVIIKAELQDET